MRPSPSDAPPPSSPQRQSQSSHPNSVAEESNKGDPSLSLPHPSIPFLLSSDGFRHDAARYVERLAEGRHDRQWLVEAMCAHGRRAAGEFDEFIRRRVEEDWDVTLPEGLGVVVRKGAATAVGNRDGSATAATNGVVVEAGEEKTQDMPGEAGDETAREYVTARREVVKSNKRPTATREDYAISSIEVGQNDPGHETRETAFTCTGGPTNTVEPTRAPDIASRPAPSVVEESPINEEQPQKAEQGEATGATNLAGRPLANDMGKSRGPEIGSGGSGDGS